LEVPVGYLLGEMTEAQAKGTPPEPMLGELIQSYERLSARERQQLVDYGRFLRMQTKKRR